MSHPQPQLAGQAFVMCRLVHYVLEDGRQCPFLLTDCKLGKEIHTASGVIFDGSPCRYLTDVPYDSRRTHGTWHFSAGRQHSKKKKTPTEAC
jgi:hypothetical protein